LFSQTFYGLLFSYLTITDVTLYVDHTVHLTKSLLQTVLQMLTKKTTLAHFAYLCFYHSLHIFYNHEQNNKHSNKPTEIQIYILLCLFTTPESAQAVQNPPVSQQHCHLDEAK